LYVNEESLAVTCNQRSRESPVMMSSVRPWAKYSCSGSSLRFAKGRTATEGLSERARVGLGDADAMLGGTGPVELFPSRTMPTKRTPLRGSVLIRRCDSPLSPIAIRAALMQLVSAESETSRPSQTPAIKSSLLTT